MGDRLLTGGRTGVGYTAVRTLWVFDCVSFFYRFPHFFLPAARSLFHLHGYCTPLNPLARHHITFPGAHRPLWISHFLRPALFIRFHFLYYLHLIVNISTNATFDTGSVTGLPSQTQNSRKVTSTSLNTSIMC